MTYEFACGDVMPGCAATFEAESMDGLFEQVGAHAAADHDITEVTPEVAEALQAKVVQRP